MNSKTDDRVQLNAGRPTVATDISGRPLSRQELAVLLLMERRNTILRAQITALRVGEEQTDHRAVSAARTIYDALGILYAEASTALEAAKIAAGDLS